MKMEIRAGEGGEDACLFVVDMAGAYCRMLDRLG